MDEPELDIPRLLLSYVDDTSDLVGVVDGQSKVIYLNDAARSRLGLGDATDLTTADIFPAEAFAFYYENVRPILLRDKVWTGPLPVRVAGGEARVMNVTVVAGVGPGGEIEWLVTHGREILEELEVTRARTTITNSADPLAQELVYAVSQGRIAPHVQPVVDVRTRDVVGYQGLARWRHRTRGLLEAGAFIDLVADSPTAPVIDLAVIRDTAAAAARGAREGDQLRVYAHLSRRLLADEHLERYVAEIVEDLALADGQFCAGIAQPLVMHPARTLPETLAALRDRGVRLVVTDVGHEHDAADIVPHGFAELRLSRQIVVGCDVDAARAQVVRETAAFARDLGLSVSAVARRDAGATRPRRRSGLRTGRRAPVRATGTGPLSVQTTRIDSAKWQATGCPSPRSTSAGSSVAQIASAFQHRVRKRHPDGGAIGEGGSPCKHDPLACSFPPRIGQRDRRQERLRVRVARPVVDVLRGAFLDDLAEVHDCHAVGDVADDRQVVRDEHVREPQFVLQAVEQVHDARLDRHVERGHRLVEHDQRGFQSERAGDADPLTLTARELVREAGRVLGREADQLQQLGDACVRVGACSCCGAPAAAPPARGRSACAG